MASQESSFDIVSKLDRQEVDNALNQAAKEIGTRFDFRGVGASIAWTGGTSAAWPRWGRWGGCPTCWVPRADPREDIRYPSQSLSSWDGARQVARVAKGSGL